MNDRYIIFADDDDDDLELITHFFKEYENSINILQHKDGKEVLNFLENALSNKQPLPQLMVLDINMPRLDGMATLQMIRRNDCYKDIAIVIYTTTMTRNNMQLCKDLNATWLIKPNSIEQIKETARILAEFCNLTHI